MGEKIPFMLKRNPVYEAIRKGKYFQLSYSSLYDQARKRVCLTNCINIVKATKGRNLILSSDTDQPLYHRSGYDLSSLLITLGLSKEAALNCLKKHPDLCVRSALNRKSYKGIISIATPEDIQMAKDKRLKKLAKMQAKIKQKQELQQQQK